MSPFIMHESMAYARRANHVTQLRRFRLRLAYKINVMATTETDETSGDNYDNSDN